MSGAADADRRRAGGWAPRLAAWLALAASPTFALMAIAAGLGGDPAMRAMCAPQGLALLGGMPPMYALMSVFHLGPWMRLVFGR